MSKKSKFTETPWKTAPISPTCEKIEHEGARGFRMCDAPTSLAYPAMGGGWMALCTEHGEKHRPHIADIEDLIDSGETFG